LKEATAVNLGDKSYGFWIVISGLAVLLVVSLVAVLRYGAITEASGVITAVGTVIGTMVGTFFGVHIGSTAGAASAQQAETGRQLAETARQHAEAVKNTLVSGLSRVAAASEPGSPTADAVQQLIDSIGAN
jgi:high-affinity nickel permease